MNVLRIPVRVMKTLIAPTVTDLTAALVDRDSLETELFVKVITSVINLCHRKTCC